MYTDVCAQLVTSNGKIYIGLQRSSDFEDKNNPRLKRILIPIEAWTTFVTQARMTLDKAIRGHPAKEPPPTETPKGRKRPYANGMFTLSFPPFPIIEFRFANYFSVIYHFFLISCDRASPATPSRRHGRRDSGVFRKPS